MHRRGAGFSAHRPLLDGDEKNRPEQQRQGEEESAGACGEEKISLPKIILVDGMIEKCLIQCLLEKE